jgi:hypothetical protein
MLFKADSADVVVYLASTLDKISPRLPLKLKKGAISALMSMEQPKYAPVLLNIPFLKEHFDLMLTYELGKVYGNTGIPNLPMTYYPLNIVAIEAILHDPRPFSEKTGVALESSSSAASGAPLLAVFASNCNNAGASERSEYLKQLMSLVPVITLAWIC